MELDNDPAKSVPGTETELDAFVYHITHDVRASLRALTIVPQWISEDLEAENIEVPERVSEHIQILSNQARRVDQMMRDLVTFSRVGRMQKQEMVSLCS